MSSSKLQPAQFLLDRLENLIVQMAGTNLLAAIFGLASEISICILAPPCFDSNIESSLM